MTHVEYANVLSTYTLHHFAQMQKRARKDVDMFGLLQARWAIIRNHVRQWDPKMISIIIFACIILHNMIIEDELRTNLDSLYDFDAPSNLRRGVTFEQYRDFVGQVEDSNSHYDMRNDLIEHLQAFKGQCMKSKNKIYFDYSSTNQCPLDYLLVGSF